MYTRKFWGMRVENFTFGGRFWSSGIDINESKLW